MKSLKLFYVRIWGRGSVFTHGTDPVELLGGEVVVRITYVTKKRHTHNNQFMQIFG